ncbi:uncharacterized protein LOC9638444 isoform X1 [Selaginella moellendorffii]|uniref:uncharacterized protein LOC9638444 isoform X1 n=1 Tax=Selaginella moellendorffii TaxID=88036 RepID=UPI000D1CF56A|nr:uncharacterized protein LOC9638444 isoform X1 [Selaginella moellendorffii]|eukprot:XP_024523084.1 uncharacterized protein LOC9638444 isoform X1 [Selaginella moellendorffii]
MRGGIASSWVEVGVGGFSSVMPPTLRSMPPPPHRVMSGARVLRSLRKLAAYCSLMAFSCLLVVKLGPSTSSAPPHRHDLFFHLSWWWVFLPLWVFHGIVSRGRFSVPAPSPPHDRHWAPCHAVVAIPLLVAFELLLCSYLHSREGKNSRFGITTSFSTSPGKTQVFPSPLWFFLFSCGAVYAEPLLSLKLVFVPLLGLELLILIDNFRMCRALMPADEESLTDDIIWETLPHFWISVSMVFFVAATVLTLLKLTGDFESLGWWDLFINYVIAECFTFLVCTKWTNTSIRGSLSSSSSSSSKPLERDESLCSASSTSIVLEDEGVEAGFCGKEDIGGHLLKAPVLISQILLCMKLEGTPAGAVNIPVGVVLMPLLVVQGLAILLTVLRVVERLLVLMHVGDESQSSLNIFSQVQEFFGFVHHGSRLLGWWSIDEKSKEEQVRLLSASSSGYYTFTGPPPDVVKKMARKDLAEEIWRLQAALGEQTRIAKHQQHEFDRLQSEKVLCRVCFERDIAVVLLPCKHRVLCSLCSERCKHCPICRSYIGDRLSVYDV